MKKENPEEMYARYRNETETLKFRIRPVRFFREDATLFNALPLEDLIEYKAWLKQNKRYTCGEPAYEELPSTRLFDEDASELASIDKDCKVSFMRKLAIFKRYIISDGGKTFAAPELPAHDSEHGFFAEISDNLLKVEFWKAEFNSVCVSMMMDKFIQEKMPSGGHLYIMPERANYIKAHMIESISSGFRIVNTGPTPDGDFIRIAIDQTQLKDELTVPDDFFSDNPSGSHIVRTSELGNRYVLNFPVSGEFNMDIYYQPEGAPATFLMSKGFCCK